MALSWAVAKRNRPDGSNRHPISGLGCLNSRSTRAAVGSTVAERGEGSGNMSTSIARGAPSGEHFADRLGLRVGDGHGPLVRVEVLRGVEADRPQVGVEQVPAVDLP